MTSHNGDKNKNGVPPWEESCDKLQLGLDVTVTCGGETAPGGRMLTSTSLLGRHAIMKITLAANFTKPLERPRWTWREQGNKVKQGVKPTPEV